MNFKLLIIAATLAFGLSTWGGALSQQSNSGPASNEDDLVNACLASFKVCSAACERGDGFSASLSEDFCREDCNITFGVCVSSIPMVNRGDVRPLKDAVLDTGPRQPALFGIEFVNEGRLRKACTVAEGNFKRTESSHSCVNPDCASSKVACIIQCTDGKCVGGMPDKPSGPMTVLGILQNGDSIDHSSSPVSSDGGGHDAGGGGGEGEPECGNIGGCDPIL